VQAPLVGLLATALAPDALLHVATDHAGYRDWIAEVMAAQNAFVNLHAPAPWSDSPPARRETAYESSFKAEGRAMAYFDYRRAP
jgi:tRNA (guanine-N7-)-methyltransferase